MAAGSLSVKVVSRRNLLFWPLFAIGVMSVLCGMDPKRAARIILKGITIKAVLR